jgi:serine/threonine protein kinase
MGSSCSTPLIIDESKVGEEKEIPLGEGSFGKTFLKQGTVIKRMKYDYQDNDFVNEMAFYGWINSLMPDEQKHFCRLSTYRLYIDSSFVHIPKNLHRFDEREKQVLGRNDSKWTIDLVLEYKGCPVDLREFATFSAPDKYKMLVQVLNIVRIMKKHKVSHEDMDIHNFVYDEKTSVLALIDYGVTFFDGQRPADTEACNEMMVQVTNMMVNVYAAFEAVERADMADVTRQRFNPDTRFLPFLEKHEEANDMFDYLKQFSQTNKYPLTITGGEDNAVRIHPTVYGVGDNLLRVSHPSLYLELYGLTEPIEPPYFSVEDVKIIYDNWNDIDRIIEIFTNKST